MFLFSCCTTGAEVATAQEVVIEPVSATARLENGETETTESFTCLVKRDDGEWGMLCDSWGDCIQIIKVNGGKVKDYNDTVEAALQLTPGDFIVQIDGKDVHPQSLPELKHLARAEFRIVRPARRSVSVTKECSDQWGLKMAFQTGRSSCLRVNAVSDGGIKAFNATADTTSQVKESDFILRINDFQADPQKMLEAFKGCSELDLVIMRI